MRQKHRRIVGCMIFISAVVCFMAGSADPQTGSTRRMVAPGAELVKVADGFRYTEGPAMESGRQIIFHRSILFTHRNVVTRGWNLRFQN